MAQVTVRVLSRDPLYFPSKDVARTVGAILKYTINF